MRYVIVFSTQLSDKWGTEQINNKEINKYMWNKTALLILFPELQFSTSGFNYPHLPINIRGQMFHFWTYSACLFSVKYNGIYPVAAVLFSPNIKSAQKVLEFIV
jgi:hypothetical protein